jgi:hypothetical protein
LTSGEARFSAPASYLFIQKNRRQESLNSNTDLSESAC